MLGSDGVELGDLGVAGEGDCASAVVPCAAPPMRTAASGKMPHFNHVRFIAFSPFPSTFSRPGASCDTPFWTRSCGRNYCSEEQVFRMRQGSVRFWTPFAWALLAHTPASEGGRDIFQSIGVGIGKTRGRHAYMETAQLRSKNEKGSHAASQSRVDAQNQRSGLGLLFLWRLFRRRSSLGWWR